MPIDPNVFDKIKTFADYQKADQDFQIRKAQAAQQLQSGGIDAQSKANIYATQVLSAATATGDQNAYDQAKAHLNDNGIDTSTWAPDVASGAKQAQAARLAQSPLGSLISAGTKMDANTIAATAAAGSTGGAATMFPGVMAGGLSSILSGNAPAPLPSAPAAAAPQSTASSSPPPPQIVNGKPQAPANMDDLLNQQGAPQTSVMPNAIPSATPASVIPAIPKFNPPAQQPGETIAAYNARVQQAFEAYKSDPAYLAASGAASAAGTEKGKQNAINQQQAAVSQQTTGRLMQNLDALDKLNADLPSASITSPEMKAWFAKRFPGADQSGAAAYSQFQEINQQQMINGLSELVKSGQIRGNQFIEKVISRGYMINPDDPPAARAADIANLRAELANVNAAAQNIAGGNQPYVPIPVSTSKPLPMLKTPSGVQYQVIQ